MGVVAYNFNPGNIFESPVDVYAGITSPASGSPPGADANCLALDSNGQPGSGVGMHLGLVDGPTTISVTEKVVEIEADQFDTAVDVAFSTMEAEVDFTMKETNLSRLQSLLNGGNLSAYNAPSVQVLQIGGQSSTVYGPTTLLLVAPRRDAAGLFIYALFYKVYIEMPVALSLSRSKESVYKVKAKCLMDPTRAPGDELGQIIRQT